MSGQAPRGGRGSGRGGAPRGGDRGGRGGGFRGSDRGGPSGRGGGGGGRGGGSGPEVRVFRDPNAPLTGPDTRVTQIEDAYMKNSSGIGAIANLKLTSTFPDRPGHGSQGRKITVYANYFRLQTAPKLNLTRYNVEVLPAVTGKKLKQVFQLLLELPEFSGIATEFKSLLIAREPLKIPNEHTVSIRYRAEGQDEPLERAVTYQVRIISPTTLAVSDFVNYLASADASSKFDQKEEVIQGLNALMGNYPQSHGGAISIGQNRHFSIDRSPANQQNIRVLGGGLETLRGYFQSARAATAGILLNVNVTHGVFLEPIRLDILYQRLGSGNTIKLQDKLKRVRIDAVHLQGKKSKTTKQIVPVAKTICGLANPIQDGQGDPHRPQIKSFGAGPKDVKFWMSEVPPAASASTASSSTAGAKSGGKGKSAKKQAGLGLQPNTYVSVFDYFRNKYPTIELNERNPVVNVGNFEHPTYFPAEVCVVRPGQTIKRRLSPEQTQQMITFACRKPWENANSIVGDGKSVLGLNSSTTSLLAKFGITASNGLITVAARVLAPPAIKYKNNQSKETSLIPRFGSWNMANIKFHTGTNLGPWTYLRVNSNRSKDYFSEDDLHGTVMNFKGFLTNSGINVSNFINKPPPSVMLRDGEDRANDAEIKRIFRLLHDSETRPRFVLVILPFNDVAIYNSIKTVADTKAGIHTVCVIGSKFMKRERQEQYFGNVSLKFNLKAGGVNQTVDPSKLGIISEGKTMVVGIDVTHPSPGSKDTAPSVASIVASIDKVLGQWPGDFAVQAKRKDEMVSSLEYMFVSRLRMWQKHNKQQLPENVIIYRDGVSEGQYQLLLDDELPLIRKACKQVYPATSTKQGLPKVSIIVCGKRHHTRFYPTQESEADRSSNCAPGTVVDRGVTQVRNWDFFMQPHACLQGTARPGHYYVILDEIFRKRQVKPPHQNASDALEDLTYNMCHLFGRATKAVSLCLPAFYADLLCTRTRCYLSDLFDPNDTSASASVVSGSSSQSKLEVTIPESIKDSMYYI